MTVTIIAALSENRVIGRDGDLPWHLPDDLERFKRRTLDHTLIMGRRTYDVVKGFGGEWPYGDRPVLVVTRRPLESDLPQARAIQGDIGDIVASAQEAAGDKDVYLDGGQLIRQAMDAELVDDLILSVAPIVLGEGHALFAGVGARHKLEFTATHTMANGMLQIHARPIRDGRDGH